MNKLKYLLCLLVLVPSLYSCDKDDDNNQVQFDKSKVEVIIGKTAKVSVKGDEASYTVKSSDSTIAKAQIVSKEITVTGVKEGKAIITVTSKSGKTGKFTASVVKDPYQAIKADTKTRFVWDTTSKIEGTDKGTYKLSQGTDGKVTFSWISEDTKSSVTLSFSDTAGSITEGTKSNANLLIDNKAVAITSLAVVQSKAVNTGDKATVWIVFSASNKTGVCVGKLS